MTKFALLMLAIVSSAPAMAVNAPSPIESQAMALLKKMPNNGLGRMLCIYNQGRDAMGYVSKSWRDSSMQELIYLGSVQSFPAQTKKLPKDFPFSFDRPKYPGDVVYSKHLEATADGVYGIFSATGWVGKTKADICVEEVTELGGLEAAGG